MKKILILILITAGGFAGWSYTQSIPTRIALITNINHCKSNGAISEDAIFGVVTGAKDQRAKALFSLGNNIAHGRENCSSTMATDLPHVVNTLRSFGAQTHFALGNHDINSNIESVDLWKKWTHTSINNGENYYALDIKDIHVIVLDTVLGGDDLAPSCTDDPRCQRIFADFEQKKSISADNPSTLQAERVYEDFKKSIELTRNNKKRKTGRISAAQLTWLQTNLATTNKKKILVLSNHPLFAFTGKDKNYDIAGREKVQQILTEKNKGKDTHIIAISGGADVWHHEKQNGVEYYTIDEYKKGNTWTLLEWADTPTILPMQR